MTHVLSKHSARSLLIALAIIFLGNAHTALAVESGYGYVSLFAEVLGTSGMCASNETEFDFETKAFDTESSVTPQSITASIIDQSGPVVGSASVTGGSRTNSVCVNLATQKISMKVIGGSGYHDFIGTYSIATNQELWEGKRIRSHIHLANISDTLSVKPASMGTWFNYQPTLDAQVLQTTPVHGVTAVDSITVYADSVKTSASIPVPCCTNAGTYSLTFPLLLPEGWQVWGFYAGLNGGSPDPISAWSGFEGFGIDKTPPTILANTDPIKPTFSTTNTFKIAATSTDTLSGIQIMRIAVDGVQIKECVFGTQGAQGRLLEPCVSGLVGPYSDPGVTHAYTITAIDSAGNVSTLEKQFVIACNQDQITLGNNPNQFKGCFRDYSTSNKYGDAPSGFVMENPVSASTTALDVVFGTISPITGVNGTFGTNYVGTFTFEPGLYEFNLQSSNYATVYFLSSTTGNLINKGGYSNSNTAFSETFVEKTVVTIYITHTKYSATSNGYLRFGWRPASCDQSVGGTNQLIGCLYKDSNYGALFGPAPEGPAVDPLAVAKTAIDFNWGTAAPVAGAPSDYFSAKWKGTFDFEPGWYRFFVGNDENVFINFSSSIVNNMKCSKNTVTTSMNGTQVYYNQWPTAGNFTQAFYCEVLASDKVTINLSYNEYSGNAKISFGWAKQGSGPTYCDAGKIGVNQFKGCLYTYSGALGVEGALPDGPDVTDTTNLPYAQASVSGTTSAMNFNWGTSSPDIDFVGLDSWSGTWRGNFTFAPGTYNFSFKANSYAQIYIDGAWSYVGGGTSTVQKTFATEKQVLIQIMYSHYTGNASMYFGWKLVPPGYTISRLGNSNATTNVLPGFGPIGEYVNTFSGSCYPWGCSSDVFGPVYNVNSVKIYGILGVSPASSGGIQVATLSIRNSVTKTWTQIWSKDVSAGFNYNGLTVFFPEQSVDNMYLNLQYSGGASGNGGVVNYGFSGPNFEKGYSFRATSIGGFTGDVFVDAVVPPGVTKVGTWPKSCYLSAYLTCDITGLEVITDAGEDPYKSYPITFTSTSANPPYIINNFASTLNVWGFETSIAPPARGVVFGASDTFTITAASKNGWTGIVPLDLSALIAPVESSIKTSFTPTTITVPANGSSSASVRVTTSSSTPEGLYSIMVSALGVEREGNLIRTATGTLYVSDSPLATIVPPPTVSATMEQSLTESNTYKLTMTSEGATSCTWSRTSSYGGDWSETLVPAPNISYDSGFVTYPDGTAMWKFVCVNSVGLSASSSVTLSLLAEPPTGSISVNDLVLVGGATTTVYWDTQNTGSCNVKVEGVTGGTNVNTWTAITSNLGGLPSAPLYGNTTYILSCGSTILDAVNITVYVDVELSITPRIVAPGGTATLSWKTNNNNEAVCTLKYPGGVNFITENSGDFSSGSVDITVNAKTTYTLTCPNPSGGAPLTESVTIEILPGIFET